MILVMFLAFAAIIAMEAPRLIKDKMWRELGAFSGLMVIAMGLSLAAVLDIKLITPTEVIEFIFKPVADVMSKALME